MKSIAIQLKWKKKKIEIEFIISYWRLTKLQLLRGQALIEQIQKLLKNFKKNALNYSIYFYTNSIEIFGICYYFL